MGFFKKSLSAESKRTALTIIAKGNKISGEMTVTGKLHIDGCVEGCITSIESLSIGKTGKVIGKITAKIITVTGLLEGEVFCEHLHIYPGGRVAAKVECDELTMDAKSEFVGERKVSNATSGVKEPESVDLKNNLLTAAAIVAKSIDVKSPESTVPEKNIPEFPKEITTPDFIQDLPDKITLPVLSEEAIAVNKSVDSLKLAGNVQPIDASTNIQSANAVDKSSNRDRRVAIKKAPKPNLERRKQTIAAKVVENPISNDKRSSDKESEKEGDLSSRPKLTNKNTTKLELKF
ncbi:MAG: polymer-forming cytoskeletal protein [Oceanospirillaceae bacterium]|nr:polymer-forming cytoskeletal protein [Oceanospirillaceae bacterium]